MSGLSRFDKDQTQDDLFHAVGNDVTVAFMNQTFWIFRVYKRRELYTVFPEFKGKWADGLYPSRGRGFPCPS